MTVQLSVDFNLKDKLHGILCSNDLEHYLKDCISCYSVCVIVICLLYQIMNNTVILKFAVCQISLISPMIKKSDKSPPWWMEMRGQLSDFIGGDTVLMRGDIRLIGGIPPSPPPLGKTLTLLKRLEESRVVLANRWQALIWFRNVTFTRDLGMDCNVYAL